MYDEQERKILDNLKKAMPVLSKQEKANTVAFTEGMAFMAAQRSGKPDTADSKT